MRAAGIYTKWLRAGWSSRAGGARLWLRKPAVSDVIDVLADPGRPTTAIPAADAPEGIDVLQRGTLVDHPQGAGVVCAAIPRPWAMIRTLAAGVALAGSGVDLLVGRG